MWARVGAETEERVRLGAGVRVGCNAAECARYREQPRDGMAVVGCNVGELGLCWRRARAYHSWRLTVLPSSRWMALTAKSTPIVSL